jgi:D-3-phosphoglycerate dehydrogenase / 2-oxoglutarate reductase
MTQPVALVTGSSLPEDTKAQLRGAGLELVFMGTEIDEPAVLSHIARHKVTVVVLRGPAPFTPKVFAAAKDLKIIAKYGAGIDSVDVASATAHGVAIMITNGSNAAAVAEHSLALMLALTRELARFDRVLREGGWKDQRYLVRDFSERTVGIVGYGQIGRRTAALASAFGAKVVIYSRTRGTPPQGMEWEDDLDRLVARVDILSLHCPLTDKTRGMIGKKQLALMKPDALIVNTARGRLIDEAALIAALKSGKLAGAGLDVYETEPADSANPLFTLPNVLCTPHIGSTTMGASAQMGVITAQNVLCWLRGEVYDPANFINPQVLKSGAAATR